MDKSMVYRTRGHQHITEPEKFGLGEKPAKKAKAKKADTKAAKKKGAKK